MESPSMHEKSPNLIPRKPVPSATAPKSKTKPSFAPLSYIAVTLLGVAISSWRWIISGVPLLSCLLSLADWNGSRVLPWIPLWAIITSLNLLYAVVATSWLLYWVFVAICFPAILLTCLYQFDYAAKFARRRCRILLRHFHFIQDTIGLFDLPALEIDTDSIGLFVIRGLTFSLSTLTATAYGVEVGVKLSEEMELAIQTDKVVVALFRRIQVGDVYANIKGSEEMCFSSIQPWPNPRDMAKDDFVASGTPILNAAAASRVGGSSEIQSQFDGSQDSETTQKPVKKLSPDEQKARKEYEDRIRHICNTSTSHIAGEMLRKIVEKRQIDGVLDTDTNLRAAICAHIHNQPTVAHAPTKSIRLSTLRHTSHPKVKKFLHRLPLLYRLILNPISYFHPIFIDSVTTAGSGQWFVSLMKQYFFKHYSTSDAEIRRLEGRISAWLSDANFAVGLGNLYCTGHVPIDTEYDIECKFKIADLMAHRTLPEAVKLTQVIHLGGADATITLPSFLLPHHEHLAPAILTDFEELQLESEIKEAEGTPKAVQLTKELERRRRDETGMKLSVHGHLPALFDQELLNFVAATVKATKVIEIEKGHEELVLKRAATDKLELEIKRVDSTLSDSAPSNLPNADDASAGSEDSNVSDSVTVGSQGSVPASQRSATFTGRMNQTFKGMNTKMRDGWRKAGISTVNVVANDRWIAKIVGNIMRKLEKAQGDLGYSGLITWPLAEYRERAESESKLLP